MNSIGHQTSVRERSIPERFEEIVARFPDRLAIKGINCSLSYEELNQAANRLARSLLRVGNLRNDSVALLFEQNVNVIVAIMGALKTGKEACVLDPRAPEARMKFIIDNCQSSLILTDTGSLNLAKKIAPKCQYLVNLDEIDQTLSPANLGLQIVPNRTAFIAYTSGSTGQPRGVAKSHQETIARAISSGRSRKLCEDDRLSLLHSVAFGSGAADVFMALLNGVAVLPFDVASEGIGNLVQWLKRDRITIFHVPPTVFRELENVEILPNQFADVRLVRLSGGPITKRDFEVYKTKFARGTLLEVGMGSTELEAISKALVNHDFIFPKIGSPIGYARKGRQLLIVADDGQELPAGQVGEIAMRCQQFTESFWRRRGLSEEKFRRDQKNADAWICLTGDIGTHSKDGFFIHLGRKDLIMKIRGYRVNVSEVEGVLLEHPAIQEAGVRAWERERGEKYLAGYIVARPESALNVSDIREFLGRKLPDYMIPSSFIFVQSLPMTNGKLDRLALPKPDTRRPELKETYIAPRNEVERKLAGIWSDVLELDDIGVHDNFFDLGGHSLTVSRVVARVLDWFLVDVSFKSFFESPTVAGLARTVENVLRQRSSEANLSLVPVLRGAQNSGPLSFAQQRLWFLNQLEPENAAYNEAMALRLEGELNVDALNSALNTVVERHEVLRTTITIDDSGSPTQIIGACRAVDLPVFDLSKNSECEVQKAIAEIRNHPFNLGQDLMLRATLLKTGTNEHILVVVTHHIASDGWSSGVFSNELGTLYRAYAQRQPNPLPPLPIQYADYAVWQRQWLQGEVLERQISFWKSQLHDLPVIELPTDRPRPPVQTYRGARKSRVIPQSLSERLTLLSRQENATLFMTLLAAFQTLLHRYTGQEDIAVGSPIAGRTRVETEGLIGFFVNTLVFRPDMSGNPTFKELLARVRDVALKAYEHQDVPFEKIVEELKPQRDRSRTPLFQVAFAVQNTPRRRAELPGLVATPVGIELTTTKFDLSVAFVERSGLQNLRVEYNTDLFDDDSMERLLGHFQKLLEEIVSDPDKRVNELAILPEGERQKLLVEWNDTRKDYPKNRCVHELFEQQVERTPEAIAVVFEDHQLTYEELNERANQVACYLQKYEVGPNTLVAICMRRSVEMIVALLGTLKAGAAYLPLDPENPSERLEFMLADAELSILLTQEGLLDHDGSRMDDGDYQSSIVDRPIHRVYLDRDWELIARESNANPESTITADNLAYVIYTSGSTGHPKAVQITHQSLLNLVCWQQQTFSITSIDRATQLAAAGFDAMVWELWPYLTVGATVHIPDNTMRFDAAALRDWLVAQAITISFVPTALCERLMTLDWPPETALRILLTGGDVLRVYPPDGLPFRIFNNYGPTECTVVTTSAEVSPNAYPLALPTIGRPIANSRVHILDARRNPVPIGVVGEIYIGGEGVARGYLNRLELTAERFINHSFDGQREQRLYKTGDLGRYLPDGNIEFIGRSDGQVKIRGFRIELGEIEAVLTQHPAIQQAAVTVPEDEPGDKRLIGYVAGRAGVSIAAAELREYLRQKLPDYMIPSALVVLNELPLTPSGKVDRRALPPPDRSRDERKVAYRAPRTTTEQALAVIWREVLKLDRVGVEDNFFDLGGHSLLATQVVSRIRGKFSIDLPLQKMFASPTIAEIAAILDHSRVKRESEISPVLMLGEVEAMDEEAQEIIEI